MCFGLRPFFSTHRYPNFTLGRFYDLWPSFCPPIPSGTKFDKKCEFRCVLWGCFQDDDEYGLGIKLRSPIVFCVNMIVKIVENSQAFLISCINHYFTQALHLFFPFLIQWSLNSSITGYKAFFPPILERKYLANYF